MTAIVQYRECTFKQVYIVFSNKTDFNVTHLDLLTRMLAIQ